MAKKGELNRTDKVREYMKANPNESNTEVLTGLEQQGIKVSRSLLSQVRQEPGIPTGGGTKKKAAAKSTAKKKPAKKKTGQKKPAKKKTASAKPAASAAKSPAITADDLYEAKKLADELGGIDRVREALKALEQLR